MKALFLTGLKYCSIFVLWLCLLPAPAHAQPFFKLDGNKRRVSMHFSLVRNMIIVPLMINNKGPYNFVLDTGVGLMIITDPKLIDSLEIKNKRLITVSGMGRGSGFEAYVTPSVKVSMPGMQGESIAAAILKNDEFGLSNYAGMPVHGLLGYEFFSSFTVKINFSDSTLTAGLPKNIRIFKRGDKIPLSIEEHKPYVTTQIKLNDKKKRGDNKLILDLGAGHPLSLENLINQSDGLPNKAIAANLGASLTGPITGYLSRVNEFEIGKYKMKDVITSFPDYDTTQTSLLNIKRDGNVGMEVLRKFNIIIDYHNSMLYLKPNLFFKEPFEHDMSGIDYFAGGPGLKHIIVNGIDKNSPADEIGLKKGDEITSINLRPVDKMTIEQIDKLFRSKNDRSILLEIFHDNQYEHMVLVLKRRI